MPVNVGTIDRFFRALISILLIAAPFTVASDLWANPVLKYGAIVAGLVMLAVAATRFCPVYAILGVRSCKQSG